MCRKIIAFAFLCNLLIPVVNGQLRDIDRLRISEALYVRNQVGNQIWDDIRETPFTLLLLTDSGEFLINHPSPTPEFKDLGFDAMLQSKVWYRPGQYSKNFLASFPAVNGVNCIVTGTPENTGLSSTQWIITLLHEHFHVYTYSSPDYYSDVAALDLSGGDQSGMWMLNFPFPYDNDRLNELFTRYRDSLYGAVLAIGSDQFSSLKEKWLKARAEFVDACGEKNYRYFSFQLWQEGIARYTEYKYLQAIVGSNMTTPPEIVAIPDFTDYPIYREQLIKKELKKLSQLELRKDQRISFYTLGFAEGLLLDELNPGWHDSFLKKKFFLERLY